MRNFFYGFLIILAAVILTHTTSNSTVRGTSSASTTTGGATTTKGVVCSAVAQKPVKSSTNVVADGRFVCDSPGAGNLWMTVTLQKKASNTDWVTVSTAGFHAGGSATTSSASNDSRTHGVTTACAAGTFRTVVEMASTSRNTTKSTSGTVTNPCS